MASLVLFRCSYRSHALEPSPDWTHEACPRLCQDPSGPHVCLSQKMLWMTKLLSSMLQCDDKCWQHWDRNVSMEVTAVCLDAASGGNDDATICYLWSQHLMHRSGLMWETPNSNVSVRRPGRTKGRSIYRWKGVMWCHVYSCIMVFSSKTKVGSRYWLEHPGIVKISDPISSVWKFHLKRK